MIAPIRREPIDFMQEIPGTYDFRTGKIKYPQSGPVGGEIKPGIRDLLHRYGDPVEFFSGPYIPDDDSKVVPLSPLGGYLGALMTSNANPFGMQAGGPSLFPIKKDLPGEVKGTIKGVQSGDRNDLSKPFGGLRKAGMLFTNEGLFA